MCIRDSMSFDLYYQLYDKDCQYSYEELVDYLSQSHFRDILPVKIGGNDYLFFTMTNLKSDIGEPTATVTVQLNVKTLDELFQAAKWDSSIQMAIIDKSNQIMNTTARAELFDPCLLYTSYPTTTELPYQSSVPEHRS